MQRHTADVTAEVAALKDLLFATIPAPQNSLHLTGTHLPNTFMPVLDLPRLSSPTEDELSLFAPEIRSIMSTSPPDTPASTMNSFSPKSSQSNFTSDLFSEDLLDCAFTFQAPIAKCPRPTAALPQQAKTISPSLICTPAAVSTQKTMSYEQSAVYSPFNLSSAPTGYRKSDTPLLPVDAPIQPRKYMKVESVTAKKAVPASFARKIFRHDSSTVAEEAVITDAIQAEIEEKRKQNTISARKSRARKKGHVEQLEATIESQRLQIQDLRQQLDKALQIIQFSQRLDMFSPV